MDLHETRMVRKTRTQWRVAFVVFGGLLVQLSLGTVFTYGNFTPYLTSYLRQKGIEPEIRYQDTTLIFALMIMGQGAAGFLGGILEGHFGPKLVTLFGSWVMSGSVMLTYFSVQKTYASVLLTYGLCYGLGVGIAYPIPMGCAMRWMPERKGFLAGLVVAGFGGGAFIFNQVMTSFLNPRNLSPDIEKGTDRYFSQPEILDRVPRCFILLGGIYAAMQLIGSLLLSNPPDTSGYDGQMSKSTDIELTDVKVMETDDDCCRPNEEPVDGAIKTVPGSSKEEFKEENSVTPLKMLRRWSFYNLWLIFLINGQVMIYIASLWKAFGQTFIQDDHFLALVGAFSSASNAIGRVTWGYFGDKTSFKTAMMCLTALLGSLLGLLDITELGGKPVFFIWMCAIFFTFSGNYSLFPSIIMKEFGPKYYSTNYGLLFTSQTVTGGAGSLIIGQLLDHIGWHGMFFLCAGFAACSTFLSFIFKPPTVE